MKPQKLHDQVFDWFERHYPDAGHWTDPSFHCYQDAPLELRAIVMTHRVEADVSNGGLPQFLWNSFFHWRTILRDAAAGYRLFLCPAQEQAIHQFHLLFEQHEPACRELVERSIRTQDFALFGQWCQSAEATLQSDRESLFYTDVANDPHPKRLAWLQTREKDIRTLLRHRSFPVCASKAAIQDASRLS